MFNRFTKAVRWSILLGMLYTLYVVTIKDDISFDGETEEKVLVEMAQQTPKRTEKFLIYQQLHRLFPENDTYTKSYEETLKIQADGLLFAHEKMMMPEPKGNYTYIEKIEFATQDDGALFLIFNMKESFTKLDEQTRQTLKKMFHLTHRGIYEHYGFDTSFRLLMVPTFDSKDGLEVMDLGRTVKDISPQSPTAISS